MFTLSPIHSKNLLKSVRCRLKLLRSKRDTIVRQLRDDVAQLLEKGQDESAFTRVSYSFGIVFHLPFAISVLTIGMELQYRKDEIDYSWKLFVSAIKTEDTNYD